jgi:hypothetical protein
LQTLLLLLLLPPLLLLLKTKTAVLFPTATLFRLPASAPPATAKFCSR